MIWFLTLAGRIIITKSHSHIQPARFPFGPRPSQRCLNGWYLGLAASVPSAALGTSLARAACRGSPRFAKRTVVGPALPVPSLFLSKVRSSARPLFRAWRALAPGPFLPPSLFEPEERCALRRGLFIYPGIACVNSRRCGNSIPPIIRLAAAELPCDLRRNGDPARCGSPGVRAGRTEARDDACPGVAPRGRLLSSLTNGHQSCHTTYMSRAPARKASLKPVRRARVKQQVFEQLRDGIVRGSWPAGTRLPSENELIGKLGCSRISIREALHMLASLGLVETRHGGGTFVRPYSGEVLLSPLLPMIALEQTDILHVLEYRRIVEPGCVALAVARAGEADDSGARARLQSRCGHRRRT